MVCETPSPGKQSNLSLVRSTCLIIVSGLIDMIIFFLKSNHLLNQITSVPLVTCRTIRTRQTFNLPGGPSLLPGSKVRSVNMKPIEKVKVQEHWPKVLMKHCVADGEIQIWNPGPVVSVLKNSSQPLPGFKRKACTQLFLWEGEEEKANTETPNHERPRCPSL